MEWIILIGLRNLRNLNQKGKLMNERLVKRVNMVVAKIIFCEASPICDGQERYLVASVIKNRINQITIIFQY